MRAAPRSVTVAALVPPIALELAIPLVYGGTRFRRVPKVLADWPAEHICLLALAVLIGLALSRAVMAVRLSESCPEVARPAT